MIDIDMSFTAPLWVYTGPGSWHFITLPAPVAERIRFFKGTTTRGFGSVRVMVRIGESNWQTSVFPDKASGSYLLPVKSAIRKKEDLTVGQPVSVSLSIDL